MTKPIHDTVLAVRAQAYLQEVGEVSFIGLPREEIERLRGSLEVLALEREEVSADPALLRLVAFIVVHHNYTWHTHLGPPRSLGVRVELAAHGQTPAFLASEIDAQARERAKAAGLDAGPSDFRLAGLIRAEQLGLVYILRRRERWPETVDRRALLSNGDVILDRDAFDPWSQLLIDHLPAL